MRSKLGKPALFLLCLSLACVAPQLIAKKKEPADTGLNEQKHAVQALNRLTFGPRPGDVQQVMAMGVDRWIDLQLHPDKIPDNAIGSRLAAFRTLHMSTKEIAEEFPDNQMIKQVMDGKRPMPSDPAKRAVFQVQMARRQQKQEEKLQRKESQQQAVAPVAASTQASDTAKTAKELAAAAASSGDANGSAPSNLADSNSMSMNPRSNGDAESEG